MDLTPEEIHELLRRLREERDEKARDLLTMAYAPLVSSVTARYLKDGRTLEELLEVGHMGFSSALDFYAPECELPFSTYAHYLIAGQIRHYLRQREDPT